MIEISEASRVLRALLNAIERSVGTRRPSLGQVVRDALAEVESEDRLKADDA